MNDFGDKFDFNAPLPPEVSDGEYSALLKEVKKADKQTKAGGDMFYLEFVTVKSASGDTDSETRKVTYLFMPKKRDDKYFNFFGREVKDLFAAFGEKCPVMAAGEIGSGDAWEPHLKDLAGKSANIHCKNEVGKDGVERTKIGFKSPNKKVVQGGHDDET